MVNRKWQIETVSVQLRVVFFKTIYSRFTIHDLRLSYAAGAAGAAGAAPDGPLTFVTFSAFSAFVPE
jgi:hypothetical protein